MWVNKFKYEYLNFIVKLMYIIHYYNLSIKTIPVCIIIKSIVQVLLRPQVKRKCSHSHDYHTYSLFVEGLKGIEESGNREIVQ